MRQLQEKIEICRKQELKILSLKKDLDKTATQLKINSKIKKNIEEKVNSNTCILRRSHDQQESREVTTQRYPTRFHGDYYKCNNYGHKAIHCRAHDRITPERNQSTFPFSVTIPIIMDISKNIAGCKDQLEFGEESKFNRMT